MNIQILRKGDFGAQASSASGSRGWTVQQAERTLSYAADELKSYLVRMGCPPIRYELGVEDLSSYGLAAPKDVYLDDQYVIDVKGDKGLILGDNPRSVLIAVYRYLTRIGCRFLRPGKDHEIVPTLLDKASYETHEVNAPKLRHRGVCIEGADTIEDILDFIDWSPKLGYNSFFLQFEYPHTFISRWYNHLENPLQKPLGWTMEDTKRVMPYLVDELEKRGMIQHRVGHGWTGKVLGLTETGWDSTAKGKLKEENRKLCAEIDGKRDLFYGVPTNTNLCLSQKEAVERYANLVADYAQEHPEADYIHLWMADASNNNCECEDCRGKRPSDHYVELLNRVDEVLTERGIKCRLVMLLYVDLLWAPTVSKIKNPDRFALMFAPITRTFERSFKDRGPLPEQEPPFELNHLKFPSSVEEYLKFLADWQKAAPCDTFDYDYYMGRAHYGDPTYVRLSKCIYEDVHCHEELRLNGISSCQELRSQFPNGMGNYVMGFSMLNLERSYDEIVKEYYEAAYGSDGMKVYQLLEELAACYSTDYIMQIGPRVNQDLVNRLDRVPEILGRMTELIATHQTVSCQVQAHMWDELGYFVTYADILRQVIQLSASDQPEEANQKFDLEYRPFVWQHELEDQPSFDVFRGIEIIERAIRPDRP